MAMTLMPGPKKMKKKDMIILCTTLSWMLGSGLSVKDGIEALLNDPNNRIKGPGLQILMNELEEGKNISEILKDNEAVFGTGHWRQIEAAERTGKVPEALLRVAAQLRNDGNLVGKVRNAVTYPAMILVFALVAGYYMFTTVVPQMGDMLMEFGVELPALTKAVMGIANYIINNTLLLLGSLAGVVILTIYLLNKPLKMQWNRLVTKMPLVGPITVDMNYSLMYQLLSDMIENGANIVEALRVASSAVRNIFIRKELLDAADAMEREGFSITDALIGTSTMPSDDKLMLQIGSTTNRDIELLGDLSARRNEEAYGSVDRLMEVMPTLVLVVVAAVVGVMVVSIYLPMISMAGDLA